eukprot:350077-Chlamydomonas_euryale.AAC.2
MYHRMDNCTTRWTAVPPHGQLYHRMDSCTTASTTVERERMTPAIPMSVGCLRISLAHLLGASHDQQCGLVLFYEGLARCCLRVALTHLPGAVHHQQRCLGALDDLLQVPEVVCLLLPRVLVDGKDVKPYAHAVGCVSVRQHGCSYLTPAPRDS